MEFRVLYQKTKNYLPFLGFLFILTLTHSFMSLSYNDDVTFSGVLKEMNALDFLKDRYNGWSSRILIEFVLIYVVRIPLLWKCINIFCFLGMALGLSYLIPSKNNFSKNVWICILLLLYPFQHMAIAGWAACTTGYFWTIGTGILFFCLVKKSFLQGRIRWYEYILGFLLVLYSSNHELMLLCILGYMALSISYAVYNKKKLSLLLTGGIAAVINLFIITLAPGNTERMQLATERLLPEFFHFSIWDKIYMGYSFTLNHFISNFNLIFIVFASILTYSVFIKSKNTAVRLISLIPFSYAILARLNLWDHLSFLFQPQLMVTEMINVSRREYIPSAIIFIILLCILFSLFVICGRTKHFFLILFILGAGLMTGIAMGFSPTVIASHYRTMSFFYFSIIISSVYLLTFEEETLLNEKWLQLFLLGVTLFVNLEFILKLIEYQGIIPKYY